MMSGLINKLTVLLITIIVIVELALTNGESASTGWLFVAYGVFYVIRIIALMITDGSLDKFINGTD